MHKRLILLSVLGLASIAGVARAQDIEDAAVDPSAGMVPLEDVGTGDDAPHVINDTSPEDPELERSQQQQDLGSVDDTVVHDAAAPVETGERLRHENQVALRAGFGVPYIFALKYKDGAPCSADAEESFCRRVSAPLFELELGFGATSTVEIGVLARLGVGDDDVTNSAPLGFGLGIRAYGSPDNAFKLFFGARVMVDLTDSDLPKWKSFDIGLRGEAGLQVDLARFIGLYVQPAVQITFLRGMYFTLDLTGGVQVRFP